MSAALGGYWFTTGAYLVRTGVGPLEFALVAYVWATLFAAVDALVTHRGTWRFDFKQHVDVALLGWVWAAQVGIAFIAPRYAQPAVAAALFRMSLAIQALQTGRSEPRAITAVTAMVAGAATAFTTPRAAVGVLAALVSAVCAAYYQRYAKPALEGLPQGPATALRNLHVCLILWFAVGWPRLTAGTHALIALAALAGPYLHNHAALKRRASLRPPLASWVALTQPLFVLAFAWAALGLVPGPREMLAVALVLGGAALLQSISRS